MQILEKGKTMSECMMFPNDWAKFLEDYSFKDKEEVYTNGSMLVPVFRVEQMIEHYFGSKWIPVSERLPDTSGEYLVAVKDVSGQVYSDYADYDTFRQKWTTGLFLGVKDKITYWMPLPEPPKEEDK